MSALRNFRYNKSVISEVDILLTELVNEGNAAVNSSTAKSISRLVGELKNQTGQLLPTVKNLQVVQALTSAINSTAIMTSKKNSSIFSDLNDTIADLNAPIDSQLLRKHPDTFLYKFSVGLIFAVIPFIVIYSFKNICPEFDRQMNMRRIIGGGKRGLDHKFTRLSQDENEADLDNMAHRGFHTAADDWDEFLGDKKSGSYSSGYSYYAQQKNSALELGMGTIDGPEYVSFEGSRSPALEDELEDVEEV